MASYEFNCIRAIIKLLIAKGIITEEDFKEAVTRERYEESQAMKEEKYKITYEEYKKRILKPRRTKK